MFWSLPWLDILTNIGNHLYKITNRIFGHGIYEVLSYEMQLDLHDVKGNRASYQKRQVVRYLQDNVIAYQDQAWGDGEILLNFRFTVRTSRSSNHCSFAITGKEKGF